MSEKNLLSVKNKGSIGKIEIAPEVIETIAGLAVTEGEGISTMRGTITERFSKKSPSQGVKVELVNGSVVVDLYVVVKYGHTIQKVANEIQTNVKQTLKNMVDLDVKEVNVHIVDLEMETEEKT